MGSDIISETILDRQADLYFEYEGTEYYFECKNNVNLDTEKSPDVVNKLTRMITEVDIVGCVSFRADTKEQLSKWAKPDLKPYLYGYNDFFAIFDDDLKPQEYKQILSCIGNIYIKIGA